MWRIGGRQSFHQATVHRFQPVERRFRLRNLYLRCGETDLLGPLGQPAGEKRLATTVLATQRLENASPCLDPLQFLIQRALEPFQPRGKRLKAVLGNRASA